MGIVCLPWCQDLTQKQEKQMVREKVRLLLPQIVFRKSCFLCSFFPCICFFSDCETSTTGGHVILKRPVSVTMNIFRLTGDLAHLGAIIILLLKIWKTRSCSGKLWVCQPVLFLNQSNQLTVSALPIDVHVLSQAFRARVKFCLQPSTLHVILISSVTSSPCTTHSWRYVCWRDIL